MYTVSGDTEIGNEELLESYKRRFITPIRKSASKSERSTVIYLHIATEGIDGDEQVTTDVSEIDKKISLMLKDANKESCVRLWVAERSRSAQRGLRSGFSINLQNHYRLHRIIPFIDPNEGDRESQVGYLFDIPSFISSTTAGAVCGTHIPDEITALKLMIISISSEHKAPFPATFSRAQRVLNKIANYFLLVFYTAFGAGSVIGALAAIYFANDEWNVEEKYIKAGTQAVFSGVVLTCSLQSFANYVSMGTHSISLLLESECYYERGGWKQTWKVLRFFLHLLLTAVLFIPLLIDYSVLANRPLCALCKDKFGLNLPQYM